MVFAQLARKIAHKAFKKDLLGSLNFFYTFTEFLTLTYFSSLFCMFLSLCFPAVHITLGITNYLYKYLKGLNCTLRCALRMRHFFAIKEMDFKH